jgi:septal ring factor EnvC (AmiA/AmiB activator)
MFLLIFQTYWKQIVITLFIILLILCFYHIRGLNNQISTLETQLKQSGTLVASLSNNIALNTQALVLRDDQIKTLETENSSLKSQLRELYKIDTEACDWSNKEIPEGVLKVLGCIEQ